MAHFFVNSMHQALFLKLGVFPIFYFDLRLASSLTFIAYFVAFSCLYFIVLLKRCFIFAWKSLQNSSILLNPIRIILTFFFRMAPSKNKLDYEINEKILCQHSGLFYEGKVIEKKYDETKKEWSFLVHYQVILMIDFPSIYIFLGMAQATR